MELIAFSSIKYFLKVIVYNSSLFYYLLALPVMYLYNGILRTVANLIFETSEKEHHIKQKIFHIRAGIPVGIYLPKSEELCRGEAI